MKLHTNRYFHLLLALAGLLAGIKIWLRPASNMTFQIFLSIVIVLVVGRSIYRFSKS